MLSYYGRCRQESSTSKYKFLLEIICTISHTYIANMKKEQIHSKPHPRVYVCYQGFRQKDASSRERIVPRARSHVLHRHDSSFRFWLAILLLPRIGTGLRIPLRTHDGGQSLKGFPRLVVPIHRAQAPKSDDARQVHPYREAPPYAKHAQSNDERQDRAEGHSQDPKAQYGEPKNKLLPTQPPKY